MELLSILNIYHPFDGLISLPASTQRVNKARYRLNPFTKKLERIDTVDENLQIFTIYEGVLSGVTTQKDVNDIIDSSIGLLGEQLVVTVTEDYTVLPNIRQILCDGTFTITLPSPDIRKSTIIVTNIGTGVITLAGYPVNGDSNKTIKFQYSTVQLEPNLTGYIIS